MSSVAANTDDSVECPLCMEPLEVDDLNFFPCTCGYQICRFCWHRIRTDENKLCPACRKEYSENPADFKPLSQEQIVALKSQKRQKDNQKKHKVTENRKHLANVRVVQKNLVFVVGLPPRLADPDILKKQEYFGKYGKIHKVVINPSTSYAGAQGPSASAYVTYVHNNDALRAIQCVNNVTIDGRLIKTSLGTTKYCSHFMKNQQCPKNDCMYLHELGTPEASFTTEEMQQGKHTEYIKRLNDALVAASAPLLSSTSSNVPLTGLPGFAKPNNECLKGTAALSTTPSSPCSVASSKINIPISSLASTKISSLNIRNSSIDAISNQQKESWPSLSSSPGSAKEQTIINNTKIKKDKSRLDKQKADKIPNRKTKAPVQMSGINKTDSANNRQILISDDISTDVITRDREKLQEKSAQTNIDHLPGDQSNKTSVLDNVKDTSKKSISEGTNACNKDAELTSKAESKITRNISSADNCAPSSSHSTEKGLHSTGPFIVHEENSINGLCEEPPVSSVTSDNVKVENTKDRIEGFSKTDIQEKNANEMNEDMADPFSNLSLYDRKNLDLTSARSKTLFANDKSSPELRRNPVNTTVSPHLPDLLNGIDGYQNYEWPNDFKCGIKKSEEPHLNLGQGSFQQEYLSHQQNDFFYLQKLHKSVENKYDPFLQHHGQSISNGFRDHHEFIRLHAQLPQHQYIANHFQDPPQSNEKLSEFNLPLDHMSKFFDFHKNQQLQQQQHQQQHAPPIHSNNLESVRLASTIDNTRNLPCSNTAPIITRRESKARFIEKPETAVPSKYQTNRFPSSINSADTSTVDADLDFDPFTETQKAFSEILEHENVHITNGSSQIGNIHISPGGRNDFPNMLHHHNVQRARMPPPPGFNMNMNFGIPRLGHFSKTGSLGNHNTGDSHQIQYHRPQISGQQLQKQQHEAPFQDQCISTLNKDFCRNDWTAMDPAILSLCQHASHPQQLQQHNQNLTQSHNPESFMNYFAQQHQRNPQAFSNPLPASFSVMGMQNNFMHPPQAQMNSNLLDIFKGRQFV